MLNPFVTFSSELIMVSILENVIIDSRLNLTTRQAQGGFHLGNFNHVAEFSMPETYRQHLLKLQRRRCVGTWVDCASCKKTRYLMDVPDPTDVPKFWTCDMNSCRFLASCKAKEYKPTKREEEDLIYTLYTAGSIVWAQHANYPWWPAMVDDCPDTEEYYWFDENANKNSFPSKSVSRAWIPINNILPFYKKDTLNPILAKPKFTRQGSWSLKKSIKKAEAAKEFPLYNRLVCFSFISLYPENIQPPGDLKKYFTPEEYFANNKKNRVT